MSFETDDTWKRTRRASRRAARAERNYLVRKMETTWRAASIALDTSRPSP